MNYSNNTSTKTKTSHFDSREVTLSQLRKQIKERRSTGQTAVPKALVDSIRQSLRVEGYDVSEKAAHEAIEKALNSPLPTATTP